MMIGPFTISMILGSLGIASGVASKLELFDDPVPDEIKEAYRLAKQLAEEGLPAGDEAAMRSAGQGRIARQATGYQSRGAAALASRGTGSSTGANEMIADVNRTQAEAYSELESSIAQLDAQMKVAGLGALGQSANIIAQIKMASEASAAQGIAGGVDTIATGLANWQYANQMESVLGAMGTSGLDTQIQSLQSQLDDMFKYLMGQRLLIDQPRFQAGTNPYLSTQPR